jgi:hypothetical protein
LNPLRLKCFWNPSRRKSKTAKVEDTRLRDGELKQRDAKLVRGDEVFFIRV